MARLRSNAATVGNSSQRSHAGYLCWAVDLHMTSETLPALRMVIAQQVATLMRHGVDAPTARASVAAAHQGADLTSSSRS